MGCFPSSGERGTCCERGEEGERQTEEGRELHQERGLLQTEGAVHFPKPEERQIGKIITLLSPERVSDLSSSGSPLI